MRVLIVDDHDENLYYLEALLTAHGHQVETARHGAEALVKARRERPSVVVSDLLMPVMDGYTLLRHWKADATLRAAPFIVYTATYTEPEDEKLAINLGADAFILKPAEPDAFIARLDAVLAAANAAMPAAIQDAAADEEGLLREYSDILIRKLEQKTYELEESNRSLQRDIANREVAEAALRESEANFRVLTDAMPQMVWITRPDGWNIFFNERWVEYTGLSLSESEGHGWSRPFHPDDQARAEAAWQQAVETGGTYSLEVRLRRHDGVYRWWLVRGIPTRDAAGAIVRWFGTCTDIDDLKQSAAQLQAAEAQLRQAQKMEAVGQLAGGIAHDFNNLLNVIGGNAALAKDLIKVGPGVEELDEILSASQRAAALTRQLLAFSRRQMLEPVALDLNEVVAKLVPLLRRLIGEHIEVRVIAARNLPVVVVDRGQIEQVILNLAVNARDAMPAGGTITIESCLLQLDAAYLSDATDVEPGAYVCLSVADTGTGIDPETQAHVFEPFFTTKEVGAGTGLGLSTVHGIITQSGGHLDLSTELGLGTTFRVYLPAVPGAAPTPAPPTSPDVGDMAGHETILVCEDEPAVRAYLERVLTMHGYTVLAAAQPHEAIELASDTGQVIDLLVTDVVMPGMSGPQLAAQLSVTRPELPVIFLSGYAAEYLTERGVPSEHVFLQKPFDAERFLEAIRFQLARRNQERV